MALRKLTNQEKVKMLGYPPFIDLLEIEAMEEAKKLSENVNTAAQLKAQCDLILSQGGMSNKLGFCKTWVVYFTSNVDVVENENDGMQLRQTIANLLSLGASFKNTTIAVLTKQAEATVLNP